MGVNGAKEMQLEIAETSVGAGCMFPKKASQGMTNPKANRLDKQLPYSIHRRELLDDKRIIQ